MVGMNDILSYMSLHFQVISNFCTLFYTYTCLILLLNRVIATDRRAISWLEKSSILSKFLGHIKVSCDRTRTGFQNI